MWNRVMSFFDHYTRARAAAEMVRMGRPELARKILLGDEA
jgi:hypothetical protein